MCVGAGTATAAAATCIAHAYRSAASSCTASLNTEIQGMQLPARMIRCLAAGLAAELVCSLAYITSAALAATKLRSRLNHVLKHLTACPAELQAAQAAYLSGPAQAALVNRVASALQDMGLVGLRPPSTAPRPAWQPHPQPQQAAPATPQAAMGPYQGPVLRQPHEVVAPGDPRTHAPPPSHAAPQPSLRGSIHSRQQQLSSFGAQQSPLRPPPASQPPGNPSAAPPGQRGSPPQPPAGMLRPQQGPNSWGSPHQAAQRWSFGRSAATPAPHPSQARPLQEPASRAVHNPPQMQQLTQNAHGGQACAHPAMAVAQAPVPPQRPVSAVHASTPQRQAGSVSRNGPGQAGPAPVAAQMPRAQAPAVQLQGSPYHKAAAAPLRVTLPQGGLLQGQALDYVRQQVTAQQPVQQQQQQQQGSTVMGLRPPGEVQPPLSQPAGLVSPPHQSQVPGPLQGDCCASCCVCSVIFHTVEQQWARCQLGTPEAGHTIGLVEVGWTFV